MTNVINKCVNSSMKKILLGFFTILGKSYRTFVEALLFPIAQTINICFLTVESKHLIVFFVFFFSALIGHSLHAKEKYDDMKKLFF